MQNVIQSNYLPACTFSVQIEFPGSGLVPAPLQQSRDFGGLSSFGFTANIDDQLSCAALIEGHPDNVAPCLYGGLVACIQMAKALLFIKCRFKIFL